MAGYPHSISTPEGRAQLAAFYRNDLLENTLPFWFPRAIDREHGGYLHCFERDGSVVDTDKSVWAQGRMAWMLLSLHNTWGPNPEWLAWGEHGLDFMARHCFDHDGRMFFHVTREGLPIRKRRYAFSESFASIAFAAHARATQRQESAERAMALFHFFTDWNFTPGRMPPKYTNVRPAIGLSPRMIALITAQELRFNLGEHPALTTWIDRCIDEIAQYFVKPEIGAVMETVAPDGSVIDHFEGRTLNPGHAIEGAWFIMAEGAFRRDRALIKLGCSMLDMMWERGWDAEKGGIYYFRDLHGHSVQEYWHDMKFWWPHDEALIATLLAWTLTGEEKYAQMHKSVNEWAHTHFADGPSGEWFGYLHRDGSISTTLKGNMWKSFFHHPRMQWLCARMLEPESRLPMV